MSDDFRPIQYLGSKFRLLEEISGAIDSVAPPLGKVCDLFAGSGVVSRRLADVRPVLSCDIQEYSRVLGSALLRPARMENEDVRLLLKEAREDAADRQRAVAGLIAREVHAIASVNQDPNALADILEAGSIHAYGMGEDAVPTSLHSLLRQGLSDVPASPDTVMLRYYGGLYFSYQQALEIDALAAAARRLSGESRTLALAALISTASEVVSTVGSHFAQPIRPRLRDGTTKVRAAQIVARHRRRIVMDVFEGWLDRYRRLEHPRHHGTAQRVDYRAAIATLPADVTAVYADPPYTRDHYSRFYHVLETIAVGDEPTVSRVKIGGREKLSRGLYRDERHQSPFCIKTQARQAFDDLFAALAEKRLPLVLSYSPYAKDSRARPRLMTVDQLVVQARQHYGRVDVRAAGHVSHSKLNAKHLNTDILHSAEVFLICRV